MPKRRKAKRPPRRRGLFALMALIAGAMVLLLTGSAEKGNAYMIAQTGTISSTVAIKGLFLYTETVVNAEAAGTFSRGFCLGDKVAAGEAVGELKLLNDIGTDPVAVVKTPVAGIFSPGVDGWETMLTVANLNSLDLAAVLKSYDPPKQRIAGFVRAGESCFKVMDNTKTVYFLAAMGSTCLTQDDVTLNLAGEDVTARVIFSKAYGNAYYALLALPPRDVYFKSREAKAKLVLKEQEGTMISASALVERGNETGVYLMEKGNLRYQTVTVITKEDGQVLVKGVEPGDCVLCDRND